MIAVFLLVAVSAAVAAIPPQVPFILTVYEATESITKAVVGMETIKKSPMLALVQTPQGLTGYVLENGLTSLAQSELPDIRSLRETLRHDNYYTALIFHPSTLTSESDEWQHIKNLPVMKIEAPEKTPLNIMAKGAVQEFPFVLFFNKQEFNSANYEHVVKHGQINLSALVPPFSVSTVIENSSVFSRPIREVLIPSVEIPAHGSLSDPIKRFPVPATPELPTAFRELVKSTETLTIHDIVSSVPTKNPVAPSIPALEVHHVVPVGEEPHPLVKSPVTTHSDMPVFPVAKVPVTALSGRNQLPQNVDVPVLPEKSTISHTPKVIGSTAVGTEYKHRGEIVRFEIKPVISVPEGARVFIPAANVAIPDIPVLPSYAPAPVPYNSYYPLQTHVNEEIQNSLAGAQSVPDTRQTVNPIKSSLPLVPKPAPLSVPPANI